MKRLCEQCNEEFDLTPDHPGRSVICRNCINDPERLTRMNREVVVGDVVYEQVGLKTQTEPFHEPEARKPHRRGGIDD